MGLYKSQVVSFYTHQKRSPKHIKAKWSPIDGNLKKKKKKARQQVSRSEHKQKLVIIIIPMSDRWYLSLKLQAGWSHSLLEIKANICQ